MRGAEGGRELSEAIHQSETPLLLFRFLFLQYPNAKTHLSKLHRGNDPEGKSIFAKGKARERRAFTSAEDEAIRIGFDQHGSSWSKIAQDEVFEGLRRPTDIRDRFRNAFPARYAEMGLKNRQSKANKKDRSASTSAASRPPVSRPKHPPANQSYGDLSLSETSDAEHELPGLGGAGLPQFGSTGRSFSFDSPMRSGQGIFMSGSRSVPHGGSPKFPPGLSALSQSQQSLDDLSVSAPGHSFGGTGSGTNAGPNPGFFAPFEPFESYSPQQISHPKSASADVESGNRASRPGGETSAGGLRRSQSTKRAHSKISHFEGVSQFQPGSVSQSRPTSRPSSVASYPSHHQGQVSSSGFPTRPGYQQSMSADDASIFSWATSTGLDLAQVMGTRSASDSMEVDTQGRDLSAVSQSSSELPSNPPPMQRNFVSQQPQASSYLSMSNDFSNVGSNSPKPRSNSIHGQSWNLATSLSRMEAYESPRDRQNMENLLDPSNATPTASGSWLWVPHSSTGPGSLGGGTPPAGLPPSYPYSHPFAGDLHVTDELPDFVDLASMHLPQGINNTGMTEQLLAQVRSQSTHSNPESSASIHSEAEEMDLDVDMVTTMDLGMGMGMGIEPADADTPGAGPSQAQTSSEENQIRSRFGSAYGQEEPSSPGTSRRLLPPLSSQDDQLSAYRSSAFAADDLALTLGNQTLFTPTHQLGIRRRRSTDTLRRSSVPHLLEPGQVAPFNILWPQGHREVENEDEDEADVSIPMPPSGSQHGQLNSRQQSAQGFPLPGGGMGTPFSDPPTADLDPTYAASLPDTSIDALSTGDVQQFSYDDIDLPSFVPLRQALDSHPLLSPRHMPLNFDFPSNWGNNNSNMNGGGRAMSVTHSSSDQRFSGNAQKAWSDYGADGTDREEINFSSFGVEMGPQGMRSESDRSSLTGASSLSGWADGGSYSGHSGHSRDHSLNHSHSLDDLFLGQESLAGSGTPKMHPASKQRDCGAQL